MILPTIYPVPSPAVDFGVLAAGGFACAWALACGLGLRFIRRIALYGALFALAIVLVKH